MITRKDYLFSLMAGFLTSFFLIFIAKNPSIREVQSFSALDKIVWYLPVLFPVRFPANLKRRAPVARVKILLLRFSRNARGGIQKPPFLTSLKGGGNETVSDG